MPRLSLPDALREPVERSADPPRALAVLDSLRDQRPEAFARVEVDTELAVRLVTVAAASPFLGRVCVTEPRALDALADLDGPVPGPPPTTPPCPPSGQPRPPGIRPGGAGEDGVADLVAWKQLEMLRIACRDLLGLDDLEIVGRRLAELADGVWKCALAIGGAPPDLVVVGMGKLGARELNYSSDVDVVLVGDGDVRPALKVARRAWRVDLDLRPEGRAGPVVRSLASYEAYWDRWAEVWEFQALLKARPVAGSTELGAAFSAAAAERVWNQPFGAEQLRSVRHLKARAEGEVARVGLTTRELKRGRGGIRDIEFCVQLLQLVHGRADASLRAPATLDALRSLADGGYVSAGDAEALAAAYRFLRTVEHRLQLWEDQPVYAVPADDATRTRLARILGYRDTPTARALDAFDERLQHHQAVARAIHERLFFRPLLEAFTVPIATEETSGMPAEAVTERLAAFGFSDADRTRQAVLALTRGLTRSSALMGQLLPRLLDWLSHSPDPDLGLLGLRSLTDEPHRRDQLMATCRESPEAARRLCVLLGTSPMFTRGFEAHPEALAGVSDGRWLTAAERAQLDASLRRATGWRRHPEDRRDALLRWKDRQVLRVAARDVLREENGDGIGRELASVAETALSCALADADPQVPMAVIGMGRLGGAELAYGSDLDVLLVYESTQAVGGQEGEAPLAPSVAGEAAQAAEAAATSLLRAINGETPAVRLYSLDVGLRPEGRQGPLARSVESYATYYARWAEVWERQALLRGRFVAGNPDVGARFATIAEDFVWGRPLDPASVREIRRMKARVEQERIPAGEDPQFHLKLGRGSLSDVEWTVQLLQLRSGVRATGTIEALSALTDAGAVDPEDAAVLADAYRFCESTRNRLYLVRGRPGDALPATGHTLTTLARSLDTTPSRLRDTYRRRTRRARRVVERLFYGRPA